MKHSRLINFILAIFILTGVIVYYQGVQPLHHDQDLWFHLAYGRHYAESGSFNIDHSQFSWTPADSRWNYGTWLGSYIFYFSYDSAGIKGPFILQWMNLIITTVVMVLFLKKKGISSGIPQMLSIFVVLLSMRTFAIYIKPENFSVGIFAFVLYLFFSLLDSCQNENTGDCKSENNHEEINSQEAEKNNAGKRRLISYSGFFILFALWVNTHGYWIFGVSFIILMTLCELLRGYISGNGFKIDLRIKTLLIMTLISVSALLFNPDGIVYPLEIAKGLIVKSSLSDFRFNPSYQSLLPHFTFSKKMIYYTLTAWLNSLMLGYLLWSIWARYKNKSRNLIAVITANIFFWGIGIATARLSLIYPLIWFFSLNSIAASFEPEDSYYSGIKEKTSMALITFLFIYTVFTGIAIIEKPSIMGQDYLNYVPEKECEFIVNNSLPEPLFNDYLSGAYLMWRLYPNYKVFVDPRWAPFRNTVMTDYNAIGREYPFSPEGLKAFNSKYPFRTAFVRYKESALISWFAFSPDWYLLFFHKAGAVFVDRKFIEKLPPHLLNLSVGVQPFMAISDPYLLNSIFSFYINMGRSSTEEMQRAFFENAALIRHIFASNVRNSFFWKKGNLQFMDKLLKKYFGKEPVISQDLLN